MKSKKHDWKKHWVGMPEFVQERKREYAKIILRFRNQDDLDKFSKILRQKLTVKTKSAWFPKLVINKKYITRYVDEP